MTEGGECRVITEGGECLVITEGRAPGDDGGGGKKCGDPGLSRGHRQVSHRAAIALDPSALLHHYGSMEDNWVGRMPRPICPIAMTQCH